MSLYHNHVGANGVFSAADQSMHVYHSVVETVASTLSLQKSNAEFAVSVLLTAMLFTLLDRCIMWGPPRQWLHSGFSKNKKLTGKKVDAAVCVAAGQLVGAVHIGIQIPLALTVLLDPASSSDPVWGTTPRSQLMMTISSGYFLHDTYMVLARLAEEGPAFLVHGACCLVVYGYGAVMGFVHFYGAVFLMWELSTPFVYARWFMLKLGLDASQAYAANGFALMAAFFGCRIAFGTYQSTFFLRDMVREIVFPTPGHAVPVVVKLIYLSVLIILNGLNWMWFSKMVRYALKKKGVEKEQVKVE